MKERDVRLPNAKIGSCNGHQKWSKQSVEHDADVNGGLVIEQFAQNDCGQT